MSLDRVFSLFVLNGEEFHQSIHNVIVQKDGWNILTQVQVDFHSGSRFNISSDLQFF